MRKSAVFMGAIALVMGATTASAQGKNFAGTWTVVADPAAAAPAPGRGGGRGLGQGATIAQDAKTLTVTRTTQNGEVKTVYNLDGSDSKNTLTMGGNSVEQVSKAKWEGDKLIITTTMNARNMAPRLVRTGASRGRCSRLCMASSLVKAFSIHG